MICPPLVMLYAGGLVQYPAFAPSSSETVTVFIFLGSKITADGDGNHETESHWLLGKKAMTNLDSVLKSRDTTLPTKGLDSPSYVFPSSHVWM